MAALGVARALVAVAPFRTWKSTLGLVDAPGLCPPASLSKAQRLANQVEWAAGRLPFQTKCLPRAIALSWLLRRERICHTVVFAVRPAELWQSRDDLHAWVESGGTVLIGALPGPWHETLRLGA
jgi:hypothetical protein